MIKLYWSIGKSIVEKQKEHAWSKHIVIMGKSKNVLTHQIEDENPSIGIIICKGKDRTTVEYALKNMNSPMGVAGYTLKEELPQNMRELLPSAEEIAEYLQKFMESKKY